MEKEEKKKIEAVENDKKVDEIIRKAKEKGKITYGELANELGDANAAQIDKIFDKMEAMGVDISKDEEIEEPDLEDLQEVEEIPLEDINTMSFEGIVCRDV